MVSDGNNIGWHNYICGDKIIYTALCYKVVQVAEDEMMKSIKIERCTSNGIRIMTNEIYLYIGFEKYRYKKIELWTMQPDEYDHFWTLHIHLWYLSVTFHQLPKNYRGEWKIHSL